MIFQERKSIITVVALMSSGITDSSLKFHLQNAKERGVTQKEIAAIITHAAFYADWPKGWAVFNLAKEVWQVNVRHSITRSASSSLQRKLLRTVYSSFLKHYGIKVGQVINGSRHMKEVQGNKLEPMPSKYPAKYRIDLHIDDDVSVLQNGKTYGFKVLLIGPPDDDWVEKIMNEVIRIKNQKKL